MKRERFRFFVVSASAFVLLAMIERASFSALDAVSGFAPSVGLATAIVAARWSCRRVAAPGFGLLAALVAVAAGEGTLHSLAFGAGVAAETAVAAIIMHRRGDPVERPETSAWWAWWGLATSIGVTVGAGVFLLVDRPAAGLMELATTWIVGHGTGLVLVSPGIWAGFRWSATGGWRHRADLLTMAKSLAAILAALGVAGSLAFLLDQPALLVGPFLVLGWLAQSHGHRVTVMASSLVATVTLLAVPMWIALPAGATAFGVTLAVALGHAAASALAIEASARWHARALLSGVVDIAAEAVIIVDGSGRVMTGNPAAERMFEKELEGALISDLVTGLPRDWTTHWPSSAMVEGRSTTGRRISLEVSVGPADAPGRPMLAMVCRDVTEIKAAAAALRRSAEIIDASPDLVGWTDKHGNLLFLNEAGRSMIGAGRNEVIDAWSTAGLLSREAILEAEEIGLWRGEATIVARTGARLPVLQTVVAHRNDEGDVRYYSILARDISERYALEQMKNEFVANVTHELRSPLTGVIGYLDLLLGGAFGDLPIEAVAALDDVNDSANLLLEMINDLLALWRAEGRGAADPENLELSEVVASAVKTMEPVAAGKRILLTFTGDEVTTVGDRRQLERAFLNLVSNAVKFTPEGGTVRVRVSAQDGQAVVEISDSGVGIPAAEIGSIFDRFFRASTAESANIPGTGLGLPLVREVITSHGGDIAVRSTVGQGTTFSVQLPTLVRTPVAV